MKIHKSAGKLIFKAGLIEILFSSSKMMASKLEFDYVRQTLTISRGRVRRIKTIIPFTRIRKIYHRIYGQEDNFIVEKSGNHSGGQSSLSVIFLQIIDMPNETIFTESYERAGSATKDARKIILRIQEMVDEIAHFIWIPVVIECKEIGFFVDMEKRQMFMHGLILPLSKIWLVQTVETEKGHYAVEVYTGDGDVYVTAEGRDKTINISDTVRMVTDRAGLPFQLVRNRNNHYPFQGIPYQETRFVPGRRDKVRRIMMRLISDEGGEGDGKTLEANRN
ncbi:MAG: hypothetical protein OEM19_00685 [Deltaproteobacteria bacterium]|nr:hypothetical protein [Deltaproteobacteria bacterium]